MTHAPRAWIGPVCLATALLAGCAAVGPKVRIDFDRTADFSAYRSYGFPAELGTDRGGYSTLITYYFKQAVDREMQQRGYTYSGTDPDLLVNFFARVRDVTDVRSEPVVWVGHGYYGYRYGLYGAWPLYADGVSTVHYKVGTANVDLVDAKRRQLIWESARSCPFQRATRQRAAHDFRPDQLTLISTGFGFWTFDFGMCTFSTPSLLSARMLPASASSGRLKLRQKAP